MEFDFTPRFVPSVALPLSRPVSEDAAAITWAKGDYLNRDVLPRALSGPAALMERGPLVLAKSSLAGCSAEDMFARQTENGDQASVRLVRKASRSVLGCWDAVITTPSGEKTVPVCDYQSSGDSDTPPCNEVFSIWF